LLRVDDANAGKRARCPQCSVVNRIPGEPVESTPIPTPTPTPTPTESQQFFIDSVSGQTYGPVTKPELDQWVQQGRVSANCQIRPTGQPNGQPAAIYYPALGVPNEGSPVAPTAPQKNPFAGQQTDKPSGFEETNPYAASSTAEPIRNRAGSGSIQPVEADFGRILSRSYEIFMREMGLLLGVAVTCGLVSIATSYLDLATEDVNDGGVILFATVVSLLLNLLQAFLLIGQTRIALKLVRGESATFNDLFSGGDKFLPIIGFYLLILIPLTIGFVLLIIPGIFLMLYFWPAFTLIVDRKTGVFESFGLAGEIGGKNLLNSFLLGLSSIGIAIAGLLVCCVGVFFASAFLSVMWATAYLMMSGQTR
jgi:hypothetical protein